MAQNYRLLEVKLKSAFFSTEKRAKRFAVLRIQPDGLKLQTKIVCDRSKVVWDNEKFVFSVSESFLANKNASVIVELYRRRKFLDDALIGKAVCSLGLLVEQEPQKESEAESPGTEKECRYDDSDDDTLYLDFYDNLYDDNGDACDEEGENLPPQMKANANVELANGLEVKGKLNLEMAVWEGYIKVVGDGNQDLAMRYEEFMGQQGDFSVRMKKSWNCMTQKN